MNDLAGAKRARGGYVLLELLVVLAIISILALVGASSLGSRAPRATRAGLMEIRGLFLQGRGLALSYGSPVLLQSDTTTWKVQFKPLDANNNIIQSGGKDLVLAEVVLDPTWRRYATPAAAVPGGAAAPTPDAVAAITLVLGAATNAPTAEFYNPGSSVYVFGSTGIPMKLASGTLTPLVNGTWATVVGNSPNRDGVPYGVVAVAPSGRVVTFFKADSQRNDSPEYQWKRLD